MPNTCARIATVCQAGHFYPTVEQNRGHILKSLDMALRHNPDLVCLPENFSTVSTTLPMPERSEPIDGPTLDIVSKRARSQGSYIICPLLLRRDGGSICNSAVIVDRKGEIAGIYDKRRPVTTSGDYTILERGIAVGANDGVFDLDFGRIGIRICFDSGFAEDWALMAQTGAKLVIWASAYDGGFPMNAYAAINRYYVVTSVRTERSRIIDPCGTTLAETDRLMNVVVRDINLDHAVCHYDFNFGIPDRILADYAGQVEIRSHFDAGTFLLEPTDPTVTVAHLRESYGFETADDYYRRHCDVYETLARGDTPAPQTAMHGTRSMYAK